MAVLHILNAVASIGHACALSPQEKGASCISGESAHCRLALGRVLVLCCVQESRLEVEGMLRPEVSKWASMGRQHFSRQEFPQLLRHALRAL